MQARRRPAMAGKALPVDTRRILAEVGASLRRGGHPFALAGAFALNAYGLGRATADLDLIVPLAAQDPLIADLEHLGFETLHRSSGFSHHLHPDPAWGRLDFIYLDERTAERVFAAGRPIDLEGEPGVLLPKAEHLIAMKVHAIKNDPSRRLRDLADIAYLVGLPGVDQDEARRYFEKAGLLGDWDAVINARRE